MSPPTAVRASKQQQGGSSSSLLRPANLIVALAVLASFWLLPRLFAETKYIELISFENPTVYDLSIEVGGPDRDRWLAITTARREATSVVKEVLDIGDVWVFRFSTQGESGGEVRLTRAQLANDRWRLRIPESVGEQLRARVRHLQGSPITQASPASDFALGRELSRPQHHDTRTTHWRHPPRPN